MSKLETSSSLLDNNINHKKDEKEKLVYGLFVQNNTNNINHSENPFLCIKNPFSGSSSFENNKIIFNSEENIAKNENKEISNPLDNKFKFFSNNENDKNKEKKDEKEINQENQQNKINEENTTNKDNKKNNNNLFTNQSILNNKIINISKEERTGRNNEKIISNDMIKCNHSKYYVSYCTSTSKNDGGLICYECLYRYHQNHISKCIPIRKNSFPFYLDYYKKCINSYRIRLSNLFTQMNSILDFYENEEIEDISTLFEEKLNLNFHLPIEVPFIDRLEIAVNRNLFPRLQRQFNTLNYNYLNLFRYDLEKINFIEDNQNFSEIVKFKSSVNFDLYGIGVTELSEEQKKKP